MNAKNAFVSVIIAFAFAFIFTACGGECDSATEDCTDYPTDNTPADDSIVTSDNDSAQPDDVVQDNEPTDADTTPVACSEDEICREKCKEMLFADGESEIELPEGAAGQKVKMSLYINETNRCANHVTGNSGWNFTLVGETPPTDFVHDSASDNFLSLHGMENGKIIINSSSGSLDREGNYIVDLVYKLKKIQ